MSDSVKKYYELSDQGGKYNVPEIGGESEPKTYIYESPDGGISIRKREFHKSVGSYTELELVETVANIARQYKDMKPSLLLNIAKDELSVKKVCD